jgi:hypothetical protein
VSVFLAPKRIHRCLDVGVEGSAVSTRSQRRER